MERRDSSANAWIIRTIRRTNSPARPTLPKQGQLVELLTLHGVTLPIGEWIIHLANGPSM